MYTYVHIKSKIRDGDGELECIEPKSIQQDNEHTAHAINWQDVRSYCGEQGAGQGDFVLAVRAGDGGQHYHCDQAEAAEPDQAVGGANLK